MSTSRPGECYQTLLFQSFEMEDQLKPVSVIFWYRMLEWIGDLADGAELVGDRMRLLIAR